VCAGIPCEGFGVIRNESVEKAFRNVDRKYFVPKGQEDWAHSDQPLKQGNIHISAPHIYGSVLEALELQPDSSMSFLNVGSGTGYMSCLVAEVLGPQSLNYGIDIFPDVVHHSQKSIQKWVRARGYKRHAHFEVLHGNALNVKNVGESLVGFDRIYVGAAVEQSSLPRLTKLLSPGGILVGPVDDELIKVVRIGNSSTSDDDMESTEGEVEFTHQFISGVRFASLLNSPAIPTVIPSRVWSPDVHLSFPDTFRQASVQLLLCSAANHIQPPLPTPAVRVNLAAMLPKVLWMEILSFTHRNWFEQEQSENELLRRRLIEEQTALKRAQQARLEAEARCHMMERERDVYRLLARRWQSRLQTTLQQQRSTSGDSIGQGVMSGEEIPLNLSVILRQVMMDVSDNGHQRGTRHHLMSDTDSDGDDDDEDEDEDNDEVVTRRGLLQDINGSDEEDDDDNDEYEFQSIHSGSSENNDDEESVVMEEIEPAVHSLSSVMHHHIRPQGRSVSISADDF